MTKQLKAAGAVLGIALLDHIIFNRSGYFSFLESGAAVTEVIDCGSVRIYSKSFQKSL